MFISKKLQSVITFELNGWFSFFSLRGLFFAKFKFQLLEHHDQLKDHATLYVSGGSLDKHDLG